MRKISVLSLQPGMKVGRTIFSSVGEIFLKEGIILTSPYIKKLIKTGIPYIYIDDGLLSDLIIDDMISIETRTAAIQQVKQILLQTKESGQLVIEPSGLYSTVKGFTDHLLDNRSLMVNLIDLRSQDDYTFAHSVNVCVLALLTGITLGYSKEQLTVLGVGALLHDLGKVKIPEHILNKPAPLTPEEYAIMKEHPIHGYGLITTSQELAAEHAIIALQHHECFDGSGYPSGIMGDAYHEYAQVVAIADKFDALTANRIYRKAYPAHEAYELCAAAGNYWFKDSVVKAFLHNIAAFPSGSLVKLSNGQLAVVLETPKGCSRFPKVRLLFDQDGQRLISSKEISLMEQDRLFVVDVLSDQEINALL